jgi:uncharacterized delta-60 repeat protein
MASWTLDTWSERRFLLDRIMGRERERRRAKAGLLPQVESLEGRRLLSAGDLDPSFGYGGVVTTHLGDGVDTVRSVAVQADGKIVAAGYVWHGSNTDFTLTRYNPDGTLDGSFGSGGMVTTHFAGNSGRAYNVTLQADGKIVAAGYDGNDSTADFALARYNADGSLDDSFGSGGLVTTDFAGSMDEAYGVTLQADGRIVAAGLAVLGGHDAFALARYNADGTLDGTYGSGGRVLTTFNNSFSSLAFNLTVQADGKVIAAGITTDIIGQRGDFALARYDTDGMLDGTFGSGGLVRTDFGGSDDDLQAVAVQADGRTVAVGYSTDRNGARSSFALARYNADGSLDDSFGSGGSVMTDFGGAGGVGDQARDVAIQPDGKILTVGIVSPFSFAVVRYNGNGTLDGSFGSGGLATASFAGNGGIAFSMALQDDGKVVTAGFASNDRTDDFALARFEIAPFSTVAIPDVYDTFEDTALNVAADVGVLANDHSEPDPTLSAVLDSGPAHGTLTLNLDGSFI